MNSINLSINPTYLCNFRCNFCYLTEEQLSDSNKLNLNKLENTLHQISKSRKIQMVDIYGGEISLLNEDYLNSLDSTIRKYTNDINVITNLYKINKYFLREDIQLSVSFDFEAREKSNFILNNILKIDKDISILMLASRNLLNINIDRIVSVLNNLSNVKSLEIKPYSSNQNNQHSITYKEFEEFVTGFLYKDMNFEFVNRSNIEDCLSKLSNSFSDDHLYITPNNKLAILEFDNNNNEYFLELDNIDDYDKWCEKEKEKVFSSLCGKCEFIGNCLTEHYRPVHSIEDSCNGFINLLKNGRE